MGALVPIFIQVLPELFKLAADSQIVYNYLHKSKEVFEGEGVWTDEADAAFTKELEDLKANPPRWLKTDAQLGS